MPSGTPVQLLGFHLTREEVQGILSEVDHDGSGQPVLEMNPLLEMLTRRGSGRQEQGVACCMQGRELHSDKDQMRILAS